MKRLLLSSAMALAAATAAAAAPAAPAAGGWTAQQAPGFYRLHLGDFRVTVLSDGTAPRDLPTIMSDPAAVRQAFASAHQALPVELSINCYLVDTGAHKILVDTGAGELFGPGAGHLVANLHAAGYAPQDIDAVLLTHIHADHSGGLSIGGQRVFPNALVYVDRRDPAFWLDQAAEAQAPARFKTTFRQSHQTVDPYVSAGMLRTFDGPSSLFPGVRSVAEYGHTPGMSGYMIESGGQRLLLWGDVVHATEAQFAAPTISIEYDVDAPGAVDTRRRMLDAAATQGLLVGGAHLSFPGLGHVAAGPAGYRWVALPYAATP